MPMIWAVLRSRIGPATPGSRRKRRDDADPALALAQHQPDAERRDHATAEEEAEVFLEPPRQRQHDRRASVEPAAEILEHRLELRHDIDEEEQQDEDRRGDQEDWVAHRRVEALLQGLAADAVQHDRAEHPFELA